MERFEAEELERELAGRHGILDRDDSPAHEDCECEECLAAREDDEEPFVETIEVVETVRCNVCRYLVSACRCGLTVNQRRARLLRDGPEQETLQQRRARFVRELA